MWIKYVLISQAVFAAPCLFMSKNKAKQLNVLKDDMHLPLYDCTIEALEEYFNELCTNESDTLIQDLKMNEVFSITIQKSETPG